MYLYYRIARGDTVSGVDVERKSGHPNASVRLEPDVSAIGLWVEQEITRRVSTFPTCLWNTISNILIEFFKKKKICIRVLPPKTQRKQNSNTVPVNDYWTLDLYSSGLMSPFRLIQSHTCNLREWQWSKWGTCQAWMTVVKVRKLSDMNDSGQSKVFYPTWLWPHLHWGIYDPRTR